MNKRIEKLEKEIIHLKEILSFVFDYLGVKIKTGQDIVEYGYKTHCGYELRNEYCNECLDVDLCNLRNNICSVLNSNRECPVEIKNYIQETNIRIAKKQMDFMNKDKKL